MSGMARLLSALSLGLLGRGDVVPPWKETERGVGQHASGGGRRSTLSRAERVERKRRNKAARAARRLNR